MSQVYHIIHMYGIADRLVCSIDVMCPYRHGICLACFKDIPDICHVYEDVTGTEQTQLQLAQYLSEWHEVLKSMHTLMAIVLQEKFYLENYDVSRGNNSFKGKKTP